MRRRWLTALATALGVVLIPGLAQAHLVSTGMGPVLDGVSHFALSPDEALPVFALGLFAGLRGPASARETLFLLPWAWVLGGLVGALGFAPSAPFEQVATAALFLLVGGLLALEPRAPRLAMLAIGALLGLVRGDADMTGFSDSPAALGAMAGVIATVFVITALAASIALPLKAAWARIAVRYAGSCMAAVGLLLVGWFIRIAKGGAA